MSNYCIHCGKSIGYGSSRCRSCAAKVSWADPEVRRKRIASMKTASERYWREHPDAKQKASDNTKLQWKRGDHTDHNPWPVDRSCYTAHPNDTTCKKRALASAQWADPEGRSRLLTGLLDSDVQRKKSKSMKASHARGDFDDVARNPSKLELRALEVLKSCGIDYVSQYRPFGCSYVYDVYLPEWSAIIEVDGDYWHSLPGASENDVAKDEWAVSHGYDIVRFPENEIHEYGIVHLMNWASEQLGWDVTAMIDNQGG